MLTDGSTGSTGSTGASHGLVEETVTSRLVYLGCNGVFILSNLLIGFAVYQRTKSLTIQVDYLSFGCEFLAVLINIVIEVAKRKSVGVKGVLQLDLVGGLSSLILLICIGLFGIYNAITTTQELVEGKSETPASHLGVMVQYSAFSLTLSSINLCIFGWLKAKMLPEGGDVRDQLNILSNLVHSLVDFVTNFAVLGTSLWLQYGVREENWFEMRKHKAWVDVFGSFTVCACILVSILWLVRDINQSIRWIRETPNGEMDAMEAGGGDYGAVQTGAKKPALS